MRKSVRITAWVLGLFILLQIGVMVVLQSPRVQTWLGKKVIEVLRDRIDAEITFQSASVRPFDAIVLDEVLVQDVAPTVEGMDTLLYVKHLSARFSLMGYFRGEHIAVSRAHLDGGCFNLVLEEDPDRPGHSSTNLQRIFRMQSSKEESEYQWGNLLQARSVEVSDVGFHMENLVTAERYEREGIVVPEGTIDWNHLNLILEHVKVNNLRVVDSAISCSVQDFYVQELATGLRLDNLSARKVRVGEANVHIEDFLGNFGPGDASFLDIPSLDMDGRLDDYGDFVEKIGLDISLREGSYLDMRTVSHFAPHMETMTFRGRIRGRAHGPVSDLNFSDMLIEGRDDGITLRFSGRMAGLPDASRT